MTSHVFVWSDLSEEITCSLGRETPQAAGDEAGQTLGKVVVVEALTRADPQDEVSTDRILPALPPKRFAT